MKALLRCTILRKYRSRCAAILLGFCLSLLLSSAALAQTQELYISDGDTGTGVADVDDQKNSTATPAASGTVTGTVVDQDGALAVGAQITLTRAGTSAPQQAVSDDNGQYSFGNVSPGPFQLTVTAPGFHSSVVKGTLHSGETYVVPQVALAIEGATTEVKVGLTGDEAAEVEVQEQYKQKVLGFIPNYYASYVPDAAPLPPRLKFQLAWHSVSDPITILGAGMLAGIYQAGDQLSGYGQGAEGYFDRFGAAYGDVFLGTFIDSALFPSLFHQDPRYFYRGTGTIKSRLGYALANAVMCRGDNGKYQVNYSTILGSFATAGISYTYYPAANRGGGLMAESALIRIAEGSLAGVFQEFVVKKLTPHLKNHQAATQQQP